MDKFFVLSPNSPTIESFIEPPYSFYQRVYFFNVTNSDAILKGEKPKVEEIGPFTFMEKKRKVELKWDAFESSVTYRNNESYFFLPQMSGSLTLDAPITTVNPVMLALGSMAENPALPEAAHAVLEMYLWRFNMDPFITKPAGQLLYEGYDEEILLALAQFTNNPVHATGKFGFFYPNNNSNSILIKTSTGADDIKNLEQIIELEGESRMSIWKTDYCNRFEGVMSAPFPRPINKEEYLYMFSEGLCRSIYFEYKEETIIRQLEMYRYGMPLSLLANSKENECYCTDKFTCRNQMADLAPCKKGAPMILSYPHFYLANQEDIDSIDGLNPNKELHETYIDIEPTSGFSLRAKKRVQLNLALRHYANLPSLTQVREVILPIIWMDNSGEAPKDTTDLLYYKIIYPGIVAIYVAYAFCGFGFIIIVIGFVIYIRIKMKQKNKEEQKSANTLEVKDMNSIEPFI